jgi:hemerythrin-like domain-containing protein
MPVQIGAKPERDFTDPIGMLGDCHRRFERFLATLVTVVEQAGGGPLTDRQREAWETSLRYFRDAAPKHTADEEVSLFPRLREIDREDVRLLLAEIAGLQQDHARAEIGHSEVDRLGRLWLANGQLEAGEASRLSTVLADLAELYRCHIALEDSKVFPLASRVLSSGDRATIGSEMASRRGITPKGGLR